MTPLKRNNKKRSLAVFTALTYLSISAYVYAGPGSHTNPQGNASVVTTGNHTEITQTTPQAVLEWSSFDIAAGESVNFNMARTDAVLNIINHGQTSNIAGSVTGAGQVYLINNHGFIFGDTAVIKVGSLVASSLSIDADDFMAGNYQFNADPTNKGTIINNGLIKAATGGTVALLGNTVINQKQIQAIAGKVVLAAAEATTLSFDNSGLMQFEITEAVTTNNADLINAVRTGVNSLIIGQQVVLEAHVAADVFTNAVNHSGAIKASQFSSDDGGNVWLIAEGSSLFEGETSVIDAPTPDHITRIENIPDPVDPGEPSEPNLNENALNANAQRPSTNTKLATGDVSSLGLFNIEAPGIRLPADQLMDEEI